MTQGIKRDQLGRLEVWHVEARPYHHSDFVYEQLWTTEELARADLIRLLRAYGEERVTKSHDTEGLLMYESEEVFFCLMSKPLLDDAADVVRVPKALLQKEAA